MRRLLGLFFVRNTSPADLDDRTDTPVQTITLWLTTAVWMAVIFYFSSLPGGRVPSALPDFVPHALEFAVLGGLLFAAVLRTKKESPTLTIGGWAIVISFVYAATDELHQVFVPGRTADPNDWVVDALGAALAIFLVACVRARLSRK